MQPCAAAALGLLPLLAHAGDNPIGNQNLIWDNISGKPTMASDPKTVSPCTMWYNNDGMVDCESVVFQTSTNRASFLKWVRFFLFHFFFFFNYLTWRLAGRDTCFSANSLVRIRASLAAVATSTKASCTAWMAARPPRGRPTRRLPLPPRRRCRPRPRALATACRRHSRRRATWLATATASTTSIRATRAAKSHPTTPSLRSSLPDGTVRLVWTVPVLWRTPLCV